MNILVCASVMEKSVFCRASKWQIIWDELTVSHHIALVHCPRERKTRLAVRMQIADMLVLMLMLPIYHALRLDCLVTELRRLRHESRLQLFPELFRS